MNDGFHNPVSGDVTFFVNFHDAAQCQPVCMWVQGADAVAQLVRQHGNDPVYKVNTCAARISFPVKLRMFAHIMRNVRDMHAQQKAAVFQTPEGNGII